VLQYGGAGRLALLHADLGAPNATHLSAPQLNYSGPAVTAEYQGYVFDLHFNWTQSAHAALPWLTGSVEEPNGMNYSVRVIVPEFSNGANWTSPDAEAIVDWLAVVETPSGTQYNSWNVTVGVARA
jgi:hypothetical protein